MRKQGLWSERHCDRVVQWDEHLHRSVNWRTWAAQLQDVRGDDFLQAKRLEHNSTSALAGRTGTRLPGLGKVQVRWADGVRFAKAHLDAQSVHR